MGCCLLVWPWAFLETANGLALALVIVAVGFIGAGLGALVSARAFDLVLVLWLVALIVAVRAAVEGSPWLVPLPFLLVVALAFRRSLLRRRLRGDPALIGFVARPGLDLTRCEFCGQASVGTYAPAIVISAGLFAAKSYTSFRTVCARHAKLRVLVPTLVTLLLGWWSLPGIVWTIEALAQNASFGIEADAVLLEALDADAKLGWRSWLPAVGAVLGVVLGLLEAVGLVGATLRWFV